MRTGAPLRLGAAALGAAILAILGLDCSPMTRGPAVSFLVDLRRPETGAIAVELRILAPPAGEALGLSSFIQPEALRLEGITALEGGDSLAIQRTRDERGFARFAVTPRSRGGEVVVRYRVRPGAAEEIAMSGLSGYRFGSLDRGFGMFGARQVFLLPIDAGHPRAIELRFLLPEGWTLASPWSAAPPLPGSDGAATWFRLEGREAASRLIEATLGVGAFETETAESFRVHVLETVPEQLRRASIRRALALEAHLASLLGRPKGGYHLVLVPKASDGMSISVTPGPTSLGLSLGEGLPTRWLTIGRAIGDAYAEASGGAKAIPVAQRWVQEALPTYLTIGFSERDGWRSRQTWLEQFYYDAAGLAVDLRKADDLGDAPEPLMREWRGALVLSRLSEELAREGGEGLEARLRATTARGRPLDPTRLLAGLSDSARRDLDRWLAPTPHAIPFPGGRSERPVRLSLPGSPRSGAERVDLYLGGRNLGLLEQCGCRSRQAGGMARRATLLRSRLRGSTPALAIELGDAVPLDAQAFFLDGQKRSESDLAFELHAAAGAAASVVSHAELSYGARFLAERVARLPRGFRLLSANVSGPGLSLAPFLERRLGHTTLRVAGVEDPSAYHHGRALEFEDAIAEARIEDPVAAVRRVFPPNAPGLSVVAGSLTPSTVLELHRELPDLDVIVTNDYFRFGQDPRLVFERPLGSSLATFGRLGRTLVVVLRTDAYGLARLGLSADTSGVEAEIEDLVLDETVADDPGVRSRLDAHYERLARATGLAEPAPIGSRLRSALDAAYVGDATCASCHATQAAQWTSTAHATAFATLLTKRRQGVPGCFACHVTGYRQPSGYRTASDRTLRNVQCESCHGPGSRHVHAPASDNIVRAPDFAVCAECHDEKHSEMSESNFGAYRAKVVHARAPVAPSRR